MTISELNAEKTSMRPAGIVAIAAAFFLIAAYLIVSGALVAVGAVSFASGRYILGDYAAMGPVLYFAVAVVLALLGAGLLRRWRLARRLTIVAAAFLLATSVLPISAAVAYFQIVGMVIHGLKIIAAVVAIRYLLLPEVVDYFSARSG